MEQSRHLEHTMNSVCQVSQSSYPYIRLPHMLIMHLIVTKVFSSFFSEKKLSFFTLFKYNISLSYNLLVKIKFVTDIYFGFSLFAGVDIDAFVTRATPEEISEMNRVATEKEIQPLDYHQAEVGEGDVIPPMTYVIDPIHLGANGELLMNDKVDESIGLDIDSQAETAEEDDHTESKSVLTDSALEEESKDAENQEWVDDKLKALKDEEKPTTELTDAPSTTDTSSPSTPAALISVGDYKLNDEAQKLAGERKKDDRDGTKITSVEEKNEGDVKWSTYSYYIRAGGWFKFIGVIFFLLMGQLLAIISSFVLALWGDRSTRGTLKGEPLTSAQNMENLNYFALYSMMGVVGLTLRALVLAQHRLGRY